MVTVRKKFRKFPPRRIRGGGETNCKKEGLATIPPVCDHPLFSPKPGCLNPIEEELATDIVEALTEDAIECFYTDLAQNITGCLIRDTGLKFIRGGPDRKLLDMINFDRIFTLVRDDTSTLVGCSSIDEVVWYERDEFRNIVECLTTNKFLSLERNKHGHIVRFSAEYVQDSDHNMTGLLTINKEFSFRRDESGTIKGCEEVEKPSDLKVIGYGRIAVRLGAERKVKVKIH